MRESSLDGAGTPRRGRHHGRHPVTQRLRRSQPTRVVAELVHRSRACGIFSTHVAAILLEEGFTVHHRKSRIMRQGVRQRLAGLVANRHANVIRSDYDRLTQVTNCVRRGPESQNRDAHRSFRAHLAGRVAFVESINRAKGKRLRTLLEQIQWP